MSIGRACRRLARRNAVRALWWLERRLWTTDLSRMTERGRVSVGAASYGEPRFLDFGFDRTRVRIGNYTSIANDSLLVLGGNHRIDTVTTFPLRIRLGLPGAGTDGQPWTKGDIEIGSDVWIGARATVLSGVTIGHGAVVGAGAVVSGDVRPYAVVAGNPAAEVKRRFTDDQCDRLLEIAWWNWPLESVVEAVAELSGADIDDFIARHDRSGRDG